MGVAVRGTDGAELGTVHDTYRAGGNDVLVVDGGTVAPSTCQWSARSSSLRRVAARSSSTPIARPDRRSKAPDPDRPKAPRRRARRTTTETPAPTDDGTAATRSAPAVDEAAPPQP